jgi:hydroxymethylpyrimidine/phosphomethylpyrimidine kinase
MQSEGKTVEPTALTIAGFDPSSGAGVTADLAVFAAHGVFGTSAITALTVQSTMGVRRSEPVSAELLAETLACLQDDLPPHGIKIGVLSGAQQVQAVVEYLRPLRALQHRPIVVLDPVLRSTSGATLLDEVGLSLLAKQLLPLVDVVTPNAVELAILTGMPSGRPTEMVLAGRSLTAKHAGLTVIVTGGDCPVPNDLLVQNESVTVLHGERVETNSTHGTGCAFSSALLCRMLCGEDMLAAAWGAKRYVQEALRTAVPRGHGRGPMNLMWPVSQREND